MATNEGGCLCGALRYAVVAEPVQVIICTCTFCQRATGSNQMIEPVFKESVFAFISGTPTVFSIWSKGSGKMVHIHFCPRCGTKICLTFERFPGMYGVYAGTFDQPGWVMDFPNRTRRIFLDDAMPGTMIPGGVRIWRQHSIANDGSPNEPLVFDEHHMVAG